MDSKDESPISEMTAIEQVRSDQKEVTISSNVLPFQENKTDTEKMQSNISEEKKVLEENSSVSIAESTNTIDIKMESKAASSSAASLSSTVELKEKESLCQGGDTIASSDRSTPHFRSGTACEGTREEKVFKSVVSSQSSASSVEAVKSTVKATKQGTDSTAVISSFLTGVAPEKDEKYVEPVAYSANNTSGVEISMAGSPRVISSQKIASSGNSQETAASTWSESEVLSSKTHASEKIIPEVYRFCSGSKDQMNITTDFQGTIPATSDLSVIGANSADTTQCENEETTNEGTSLLNTREQESEEVSDDEGRASFYISSCSVPGMGEGSEWPSISDGYQMPIVRPGRRIAHRQRREPRRCLGTQRCHYGIVAVALMTAFAGCIAYHLSNSGIGPNVLKPIGASTAFISFAVCVFSAVYIKYLGNQPALPIMPNYELLGDVDNVMAMNRSSDPEFYYAEDGTYGSMSRTAASEFYTRETQSADVLDRRGYGRYSAGSLQTDSKRFPDESGTPYSTQPPKKFKAMQSSSCQEVDENNSGQASSSPHTCEGISHDSQSSDGYHESDTQKLLSGD